MFICYMFTGYSKPFQYVEQILANILVRFREILTPIVIFISNHGVKRVRILTYSGPHFSRIFQHSDWIRRDNMSPYSVQMRENLGKMRTRITQNTDSFYAVNAFAKFHKRRLTHSELHRGWFNFLSYKIKMQVFTLKYTF